MAFPVSTFLTPDEYLAIEREAPHRSEYIGGRMFAMAGATANHARIVRNALTSLDAALVDSPCEPFATDLRLYSLAHQVYTYPDILVTCGSQQFLDERWDTVTDATLIIEVLSPSTSNYDRAEKFEYYRSLPSFAEYLLIRQDRIGVEHHTRQADGTWLMREYIDLPEEVECASVGCRLSLSRLYARVEL
jgi:Uma2 family endonuclease